MKLLDDLNDKIYKEEKRKNKPEEEEIKAVETNKTEDKPLMTEDQLNNILKELNPPKEVIQEQEVVMKPLKPLSQGIDGVFFTKNFLSKKS